MYWVSIDGLDNDSRVDEINAFIGAYRFKFCNRGFQREVDLCWFLTYVEVCPFRESVYRAIQDGEVHVDNRICTERFLPVNVVPPPVIRVRGRFVQYGPKHMTGVSR